MPLDRTQRVSLRSRILLLVTALVVTALVFYAILAARLFQADKRAYIYDLNGSVAQTLARELESSLGALSSKLLLLDSADDARISQAILASEPEVLRIMRYRVKRGARPSLVRSVERPDATVATADLELALRTHPIDFDATLAAGAALGNASLPPDLALLWFAKRVRDDEVLVMLLTAQALIQPFSRSAAYVAALTDLSGNVILHPDADRVLSHASLREIPAVAHGLRQSPARAVTGARHTDGSAWIGAYVRLGSPPVLVVTETDEQMAYAATRELVIKSALFCLAIIVLAFLLAVYLSRRIAAPLKQLTAAMSAVADGDFKASVQVQSGDEVGVLSQAFNVMATELQARETRLNQARDELVTAEKLAALGVLASELSHEIKNPLTSVLGFAQLAMRSEDPAEIKESLQTIDKQTRRVKTLLDDILSYTRDEPRSFSAVDVSEVVRDTLRLVRPTLHEATLDTHLPTAPALVRGNGSRLQQVLLNLLVNAAHALEGSAGTITVTVDPEAVPQHVRISVTDTGTGMSDETMAKLFKPFFTTKPRGKGTGLGLSVSQQIVAQHEGRLYAESTLGRGSTFHVELPCG